MNTRALQLANALVLVVLCFWGVQNVFHLFLAVSAFCVLLVGSIAFHGLVGWYDRRRGLAPAARTVAYLLPALVLVTWALVAPDTRAPNQRRRAVSPSGQYVLTVPIENNHWTVTIRDPQGRLLYRDNSDFLGHFSAYWLWDGEDRVWLYNSDDSAVYFWEARDGAWRRTRWGSGRRREIERLLAPPEALYPAYEREKRVVPAGKRRSRAESLLDGRKAM